MTEPRPTSTRQVHLAARPEGALTPDACTTVYRVGEPLAFAVGTGLAGAPQALVDLLAGSFTGSVSVEL